jgi:aminoglycoside phosphotransferase (APT) family kinase protein
MPVHVERDADETRRRLAAWLTDHLGSGEVAVSELSGNPFSGFSNETLIFDASFEHEGVTRTEGMVVRVEPIGHQVFPTTAFRRQWEVMSSLAETDVPVPVVAWYEDDTSVLGAPFFVMQRVDGRVPTDNPPYHMDGWMLAVSPDERERIWWSAVDVLARIHRVSLDGTGLGYMPAVEPAALVDLVREYFTWAAQGRSHPVVECGLDWLAANVPERAIEPALCWGDARVGNMIFDDSFDCVAVLDWEMVTVGDPVQDLAWFLFLDRHHSEGIGVPRLKGMPSAAATIDRWQELTGRAPHDIEWYEVLAGVRFSAIMLRVIDLAIASGAFPADATMGFDNPCVSLTAQLLDQRGA